MNREQIDKLLESCPFQDQCHDPGFFETHISWVILTDHYAFKIKRPVKYSFLDFSTLRKRRHYCEEEVELNRRLAPEMYLGVIPITEGLLEREGTKIIEYAVQMKRMDNSLEMDRLLKEGKLDPSGLERLAEKIARFHQHTRIIKNAFDTTGFQEKFADLLTVRDTVQKKLGDPWVEKIDACAERSNVFLNSSRNYFNQRIITNFRRDCHGDLNASNIFLYEDPVVFDCIEFNKEYRHIDVLNEIAFLCVDLDFFGYRDLSEHFYRSYLEALGVEEDDQSGELFMYYKSYRANVRAKVTAISIQKTSGNGREVEDLKRYISLMDDYCSALKRE